MSTAAASLQQLCRGHAARLTKVAQQHRRAPCAQQRGCQTHTHSTPTAPCRGRQARTGTYSIVTRSVPSGRSSTRVVNCARLLGLNALSSPSAPADTLTPLGRTHAAVMPYGRCSCAVMHTADQSGERTTTQWMLRNGARPVLDTARAGDRKRPHTPTAACCTHNEPRLLLERHVPAPGSLPAHGHGSSVAGTVHKARSDTGRFGCRDAAVRPRHRHTAPLSADTQPSSTRMARVLATRASKYTWRDSTTWYCV